VTPVQTVIKRRKSEVNIEIKKTKGNDFMVSCPDNQMVKAELYIFSLGIMINFGRIYQYLKKTTKNDGSNFVLKHLILPKY